MALHVTTGVSGLRFRDMAGAMTGISERAMRLEEEKKKRRLERKKAKLKAKGKFVSRKALEESDSDDSSSECA